MPRSSGTIALTDAGVAPRPARPRTEAVVDAGSAAEDGAVAGDGGVADVTTAKGDGPDVQVTWSDEYFIPPPVE